MSATVHVLRAGVTLCSNTTLCPRVPPMHWPDEEKWVSFEDPQLWQRATCKICRLLHACNQLPKGTLSRVATCWPEPWARLALCIAQVRPESYGG